MHVTEEKTDIVELIEAIAYLICQVAADFFFAGPEIYFFNLNGKPRRALRFEFRNGTGLP